MATATIGRGMTAARSQQARQKKIVIGGAALLAVVLVIQVPRTMKMLSGSESTAPAPAAAPAPAPVTPAASVPAAPVTPTALPADGKLVSFERFRSKDPFIQQVTPDTGAKPVAKTKAQTVASEDATKAKESSLPTAFKTNSGSGTTGATSATIKLNGVEHTVAESKTFPKADPVFKLVSVSGDAAEIGIADGSFKEGGKTISLRLGEPVTLMNTADGKRYKLELVSTSG